MTAATSPAPQHPIATTSATPHAARMTYSHSPIVRAMLTNNRMQNCHDVATMVRDCHASGSNDRICRTATGYLDICMKNGELP
eukprot:CAMPEP_0176225628 /NCGR_PEP_ID=MMETSP0121_2-20121125/21854_1 /TAXON_ID=160619 /ORGANISM="Kryptoperidinium foliaceum, Strain CCMP 1326" /LENGTH=82 /DNA_ID=CAMNT_0017564891 /DNA_START=90 /DNA_END=338 /DNA_ORIENTATION=+